MLRMPHAPEETSPSTGATSFHLALSVDDTVFEFEPRESTHDSRTPRQDS
jgi:hypothetical protein